MEKQKTKCMYLGVSKGISKKNNKPFWVLQVGVPMPAEFDGVGYLAKPIYLDSEVEYSHCLKYKCGDVYELGLLYVGGNYKVVSFA